VIINSTLLGIRQSAPFCVKKNILNEIFETLIETYLENKVGITENFLHKNLSEQLKIHLLTLYNHRLLTTAGTGNEDIILKDTMVRSDKIYWLDRSHQNPFEDAFFDVMDDFVRYLNETCYVGITHYEFHYAMYEKGSFYKRHLDRFKNDDSRLFSMITYLNPEWKEGDGGELNIYREDGTTQKISPTDGKSVFFKSDELEHEVLETMMPRMSITGWLRK
jgi:SM-20-related protein